MASDVDRWWFLMTLASLPLACTEDPPISSVDSSGTSGGSTTGAPEPASSSSSSGEGATSIVTTSLDGTSSSGADSSTTAIDGSTASDGTSSSGTTMPIDPGSSSSTTEEPLGLCELWATEWVGCYGDYDVPYLTNYCYDMINYAPAACQMPTVTVIQCEAYGGGPCLSNCDAEGDALQQCEDEAQAMELGCDMIALVPAVGTIEAQCTALAMQATACDAAGYYLLGFSQYVDYPLDVMVSFCVNGLYVYFGGPPLAVGDTCGGAYEELLTCLSGVSCNDLQFAAFDAVAGVCETQYNGVECRCELGV